MLFSFLSLKHPSLVALDIQERDIFLIKINKLNKDKPILAAVSLPLAEGIIRDGRVIEYDSLVLALSQLVRQTKTQGFGAAIAISNQYVMSKQVSLPFMAQEAEYEAEICANRDKYLPGVTGDVYFDYCFLPSASHSQAIQFVAAKSDMVDDYVNAVNQSGLKVKIIDIDCYAIARVLSACTALTHKTVGFIDIGPTYLRILYLQDKQIIFTQQLNIQFPWVDALKIISQQVLRSIQMCCAAFKPIQVDQLYLVGTSLLSQEFLYKVSQQLAIPVDIPNFHTCFTLSEDMNTSHFSDIAMRSFVGLGLALRECPTW